MTQTERDFRFAAIDMGTNTFHAVFVSIDELGQATTLGRKRVMVDLAPSGLGSPLTENAMLRGFHALMAIKAEGRKYQIDEYTACATSAIREAPNGQQYLERIFDETGIQARIISGKEEASLIALGIQKNNDLPKDEAILAMDIGGGSVEFIIMRNQDVLQSLSKKIGVARMRNKFLHHDPMTSAELSSMLRHFSQELNDLLELIDQFNIKTLIGSSGTLRNIFGMITHRTNYTTRVDTDYYTNDEYQRFFKDFVFLTHAERLEYEGVDPKRVNLIQPGVVLMHFLLKHSAINTIKISKAALREGMVEDYYLQTKKPIG